MYTNTMTTFIYMNTE